MRYGRFLMLSMLVGWLAPVIAAPIGQQPDQGSAEKTLGTAEGECALPPAEATKLDLIRQMLKAGKPHAAIAYLDASQLQGPPSELIRADALRMTGRERGAEEIYRKLVGSCVKGYAYQGLGLIANKAGNTREALLQLQAASRALPIDPAIRNDYGYALLQAKEDQAALHEFLTAIELAPGERQAAYNLVLLMLLNGDEQKAQLSAKKFNISEADVDQLRQMAKNRNLLPAVPYAAASPIEAATSSATETRP